MAEPSQPSAGRRRQHIWIVLPAYNEAASLPQLLDRIEGAMAEADLAYQILLVDDGSVDSTLQIAEDAARRLPLTIEEHPQNKGLGKTIRDGLTKAAELADPDDILVTMDADNSHTPELVWRMVRQVREGYDVVVASRYRPGSRVLGLSWFRRALSYWGSWLFRLVLPIRGIRDFTCGYRAYRAEVMQQALADHGPRFFDQEGFQCMVDILLKLRRRDLIFGEVPMVLRYDLKEGASKMRLGMTIRDTLLLILKRRFGSS